MAKVMALFTSYRDFKRSKVEFEELFASHPQYETAIKALDENISSKFPILVLIDLGGTVLYRTDQKDCGRRCDYKFKKYQYFWRPGYGEFILKLQSHPRIKLCFYSSMMRKTIVPCLHELMHDAEGKLDAIKSKVGIFDREYCKEMRDLKYYDAIKEEKYDTYRDLHSIFSDPFCKQLGFTEQSTILVDSESRKVQLWLDNCLISEPYTAEDVCLLPSQAEDAKREEGHDSQVRDAAWQTAYLDELAQFIITVVESGVNVPEYLSNNRPEKYKPELLLPELSPELLAKARANIKDDEEQKENQQPVDDSDALTASKNVFSNEKPAQQESTTLKPQQDEEAKSAIQKNE